MQVIDAKGVYYRELNQQIKNLIADGEQEIVLNNINGQRYLGDGLQGPVKITVDGTPGNDMAAFANGIEMIVNGNVQDATANTMNEGRLIINGNAGDITGYSMRGGCVYIKEDVGYRVGIHMKGYLDKQPVIIVGGCAGDFFGEYMAGGCQILLGLNRKQGKPIVGNHVGVGMHGGVIYIRDKVEDYQVGIEVEVTTLTDENKEHLSSLLNDYCQVFNLDLAEIMDAHFSKLIPVSSRPYGNMYAY